MEHGQDSIIKFQGGKWWLIDQYGYGLEIKQGDALIEKLKILEDSENIAEVFYDKIC